MRMLFCCEFYYPSVGGVAEVMCQIAERMALAGHDVTVATSHHAERKFETHNGVRIHGFKVEGNLVRGISGEAASLANPLREDAVEQRRRIRAAYETLVAEASRRNLIDQRRAAVGFCFGGGNVLELARDGADLAAAVSIHGDLKTVHANYEG